MHVPLINMDVEFEHGQGRACSSDSLLASATHSPLQSSPLPLASVWHTLLTMSSAVRACVYDVPLALDDTLSRTRGLDPRSAMARNDYHLHDCIDHLLGPMPPKQFLDVFLPWGVHGARKGRSLSRNAFKDVPLSWNTVDDMYAHLVSTQSLHPSPRYLTFAAPCFE